MSDVCNALKFKVGRVFGLRLANKPDTRSIAQSKIIKDDESDKRRNSNRARSRKSDEPIPEIQLLKGDGSEIDALKG